MGWIEFLVAFAVFFLTHSIPVRPTMKPWLTARLGAAGFNAAYSLLSLSSLMWLILAAARAPFLQLWPYAQWQNHIPLTAMLPVCLIAAFTIGRPNPFSFGGAHNDRFDPAHPGIVRLNRHPWLLAIGIWAVAHLFPNGNLAHVLLFGVFLLFAIAGARIIDRRKKREMGSDWATLLAQTREASLFGAPLSWGGLTLRLLIGIAAYFALMWLHPYLFGVSPFPG